MNRREQFLLAELVRLARQNPDWSAADVQEAAEESVLEADADEENMRLNSDEPKDHAFNDCLDRHNPACPWAF